MFKQVGVICCILVLMMTPVLADQKETIPITDLTTHALITQVWDTVNTKDISHPNEPVISFRQVKNQYTRQQAYKFTSSFENLDQFRQVHGLEVLSDQDRFIATPTQVSMWSIHFSNVKYPTYTADRTQILIHVPKTDRTEPITTLVHLPIPEEMLIVRQGSARIFDDGARSVVRIEGDDTSLILVAKQEMIREAMEAVHAVSYATLPAPVPRAPQTHTPTVIAGDESQTSGSAVLMTIGKLMLLVIVAMALFGGLVVFRRKQRMRQLILKYSEPMVGGHYPEPVQNSSDEPPHALADKMHALLRILRRRER